jgi:hypothetical protein
MGAGTIRQVCKEWKCIVGRLFGGRKTHVYWVAQRISTILWAQANGAPTLLNSSRLKSIRWNEAAGRKSPFSVLVYLHNEKLYEMNERTMNYLTGGGRFDDVRRLHYEYNIGFTWIALVAAGVSGHIEMVRWMLDIIQAVGIATYYKNREVDVIEMNYIIISESIIRTDNCIMFKEFVRRGALVDIKIHGIIDKYKRYKTRTWVETNVFCIKWADTS